MFVPKSATLSALDRYEVSFEVVFVFSILSSLHLTLIQFPHLALFEFQEFSQPSLSRCEFFFSRELLPISKHGVDSVAVVPPSEAEVLTVLQLLMILYSLQSLIELFPQLSSWMVHSLCCDID